jgi:hypothetical protein
MERSFGRGNGEGSKGPDIEEKWMMRKTWRLRERCRAVA